MELVIRLDETLALEIERRARERGVEPAEYALAILREALDEDQRRLEEAMAYTLEKNAELYRRLAKGPE